MVIKTLWLRKTLGRNPEACPKALCGEVHIRKALGGDTGLTKMEQAGQHLFQGT